MTYLVDVGRCDDNKSGTNAKGYRIRRTGETVRREWGAISVGEGAGGRYYWRGLGLPESTSDSFASGSEARKFKTEMIAEKLDEGYEKLPKGRKIHPFSSWEE